MEPPKDLAITRIDWRAAQAKLKNKIAEDEYRIVEMLGAGKSTPDIAKALGTNRSAIWRRIQRIKQKLATIP
jgi:DNA-binding NarL/FixJ family response regulator